MGTARSSATAAGNKTRLTTRIDDYLDNLTQADLACMSFPKEQLTLQ